MDKNKIILYILYGVLIVVLGYAVYATSGFGLWKNSSTSSSNSGKIQAVFLSNGQVYFGKLSGENSQFATLKDIYYLRTDQIQPKPEAEKQQKLTLVKLGNEIHGPEDEMRINRDHILFVEDLKTDGSVVQAIEKYRSEGPTSQDPDTNLKPTVEE